MSYFFSVAMVAGQGGRVTRAVRRGGLHRVRLRMRRAAIHVERAGARVRRELRRVEAELRKETRELIATTGRDGNARDVAFALVAREAREVGVGDRVRATRVDLGIFTRRRHLPTCMTSGISAPAGTFFSSNLPSTPVTAVTSGLPESLPHCSQLAPSVIGSSGAFGTYTVTL